MLARKMKTSEKKLYRIMFFPKQDKYLIFKSKNQPERIESNWPQPTEVEHYTLANDDTYIYTNVEATNINQAFSEGIYKLEKAYEDYKGSRSEVNQ